MPRIRKYENRRLYDTEASSYVNLDDIAALVRAGHEVVVEDAKTGADITQEILLQVVVSLPAGAALVPVGLLRRLIRAASNPALAAGVDPRLAQGLNLFHRQLEGWEAAMPSLAPWATEPAAAPSAGMPRGKPRGTPAAPAAPEPASSTPRSKSPPKSPPRSPPPPEADPPEADPELDALRKRLDDLEQRLRRR